MPNPIRLTRKPLTPLSAEELGRRIRAARILRNLEQKDLDDLFEDDGVGRSAGFLERGSPRAPLTRARLDSLVRHLRVPETWFTAENVDDIVGGQHPGSGDVGREIAALRHDLAEVLSNVQQEQRGRAGEIREMFGQYLHRLETGTE
jgi:hypothetical protein